MFHYLPSAEASFSTVDTLPGSEMCDRFRGHNTTEPIAKLLRTRAVVHPSQRDSPAQVEEVTFCGTLTYPVAYRPE